jgi:hypothetical protein
MDSTDREGPIPWFIRLAVAKQDSEAGVPLAIDECVLACYDGGKPIPEWAMPALAERSKIKLGLKPDPAKKGGPHANPRRAGEDRKRHFAVFCAMVAAWKNNYKGDLKLDLVRYLLNQEDIFYECDTIEKIHKKMKKKYKTSDYVNSWPVERFELGIENYKIEIQLGGRPPREFWD